MIGSEKALEIILENTHDFGVEEIAFNESLGCILKEEIVADRDFPPFHRVSMDGIAVAYHEFQEGQRVFKIEGVQAAGQPRLALNETTNCLEVMTGATLPEHTDTVIRYEDVILEKNNATITIDEVTKGQNIHNKARDRKRGDVLIRKNTLLSAAEIGVLATVGKSTVKVARRPKVMVISTGDELVAVNEQPKEHQIRRSNVFSLCALLQNLGIQANTHHISDDKEALKEEVKGYLKDYDILMFSGAVSKGKFDYLPVVLDELGVEKLFHRVAQRPGKPFWYGKTKSASVFAFPGNPVSTFICCLKYFFPWYKKSAEIPYGHQGKAILGEDFEFHPELTYFLQVRLDMNGGLKIAKPVTGNGSGDLANLVDVDGFLELPQDQSEFKAGEAFPLITFR